jgi:DNA polymerase I-like protein with 3'-5' exonuclease and polymerase domains
MRYKFIDTPEPMYVSTREQAVSLVNIMSKLDRVGFDTETTGLSKTEARIKFFSFGFENTRFCAPVRLLPIFQPILECPTVAKCMTNAKFDMHMVANHGIEIKGHIFDTVAMDWLHDENRQGRHGLKQCAADYLGLKMAPFTQVFGSVGTTDKEVETLCRMHDALETKDPSLALELLALVGQIEMDPGALEDMQLVSKRLAVGRSFPLKLLTASQVLKIGRKYGLCPTTRGKAGYVSDFSELMGLGPVDKDDRDSVTKVLGDSDVLIEAHEILLHYLSSLSQNDRPPLDMIQLMVGDYASLDAWASFMLVAALEEKLSEEFIQPGVSILDYYNSTTATLVRILWMLERRGFQLDVDEIEKLATPMANDISRLEREFVSLAGWSVNPNSPTQLVDLFFEKRGNQWVDPFGAPPWKMSSGGTTGQKKPSISKEVIDDWAEKGDPRAKCLQEHRVLQKLHSTYIDALPKTVDWRKRIHTDLKIAGTVTGRLSSGDPNLQNIPARGDWGRRIRKFFIAGKWGSSDDWCLPEVEHVRPPNLPRDQQMVLVVADYEQLEMRIMAHMSGDPTMISTIKSGKDLHSMTGALAVGANYDDISAAKKAEHPTKDQLALLELRAQMKAVGFGLLYGIGAKKLGSQLGLKMVKKIARNGASYDTCPEAEELIQKYFSIYPKVFEFIEDTHYACQNDLFVQTILGRYRRLPDILSKDKGLAKQAERQSVNSRIQGSAADIAIQAMINCETSPILRSCGVRMLMQIHDELVFEVPDIPEVLDIAKKEIRAQMENPFVMDVPILISMDSAASWGDAK